MPVELTGQCLYKALKMSQTLSMFDDLIQPSKKYGNVKATLPGW